MIALSVIYVNTAIISLKKRCKGSAFLANVQIKIIKKTFLFVYMKYL